MSAPSSLASPPQNAGPAHALTRSTIRAAIGQGLGAFLQHVELDDKPVLVGGKFHGFRITALHDGSFWSGVDLRPGDVVTRVNGLPIERPEQAQMAFESLGTAKELRVAYERDGEPLELVVPIAEDR
jgi:type II secretion system protein C